jgi:type VI secretion system protein ImpH
MAATRGGTTPVRPSPPAGAVPRAGPAGPPPPRPLAERLFAEGYAFDFFQAVRLLEALYPGRQLDGPDEPVRFRAWQSLSFPPSAIAGLRPPVSEAAPAVMTVAFMGLTGPSGVLPRHYTELLLRLQRDARGPERTALRDWLDLFNDRLITLFYQTWRKYRFWLAYERRGPEQAEPDPFTRALRSLTGTGTPGLRDRLRVTAHDSAGGEQVLASVDDQAVLFYGGLFAHRPRCAAGLNAILADYFRVPAKVLQFQGQWLQLDDPNRSHLGSANSTLGSDLVVGQRVWDVQNKVRVRLGPLRYSQFQALLPDRAPAPGGKTFFSLLHLVRLYAGPELDVDVQLVPRAEEVPECLLPESTADGPRLGWDTWLTSQSLTRDPEEAVFEGVEVFTLGAP